MSAFHTKDLSVGHLNVYHLANKVPDVNVFLSQLNFLHIFGVSESRLTSVVSDEVLMIPNYSILRRDGNGHGHTGIAVYVHDSIRDFTSRRYDLESVLVESIWLQVKTGRGPPLLIAFIYRNPSSNFVWFDDFVNMMDSVQKHDNDILLLGDFNIDMLKPNPAWASTISLFNLHQSVTSPTRVTSTTKTLIDHIYANNPDRLIHTYVPTASMSDHYPVCCTLHCQVPQTKAGKHTTITYRSYKHFDTSAFLNDLSSCPFDAVYEFNDPDEALAYFCKLFSVIYDRHAPVRRKRVKEQSLPPWLTIDIRKAMNQRDRFKKAKNYSEFKNQRRHVKYLVRQAKKAYFDKIVSAQTDNTSLIWKALNVLSKRSSSSRRNMPNTHTAEAFNDHFLSVARTLTKSLQRNSELYKCSDELKNFCSNRLNTYDTFSIPDITVYEVGKYISSIGRKGTSGCDGFSNTILMLSLPFIVQHLTYVYNLCLKQNCFPSTFKTAKVIPLPKSKDLTDMNNFRPISILSSLSKPLEKHVHRHLLKYLDRFNLIHVYQSGFRPKHSCQTALTCFIDRLLSSINDSDLTGVVFLDLKKAFDLVNHNILINKLKTYQLSDNAVQFFSSYLSQRRQKVFVNGHYSSEGFVQVGVPQGSVLGPLLFSIYINDLPLCISSADVNCDMFADDSSLTAAGENVAAITTKLQPSVQEVSDWCSANAMLLNPRKTKSMVITTRQKHQRVLPSLDLLLSSQVIEQVSEHRHLGVIIDDQLKWQAHINCLTNTIAKNVYLLSRLRFFSNSEACRTFFFAHIMSRINYVSNAWDSCSEVHMKKLKSVHKRGVRVLCSASRMLPGQECASFDPLPLKYHLQFNKCILVHKVVHNKSPIYLKQFLQTGTRHALNSRNNILVLPKTRIDLYKTSFSYSGSSCWNELPSQLKTACSIDTFKLKLFKHFNSMVKYSEG